MGEVESEEPVSKREAKKALQDLKIITAISMGKDRNKELAKVLDTDKSFAAKKVKELEERGLVQKNGEGKETRYSVVNFNVFKFLQSKVVITVKKEKEVKNAKKGKKAKG
jgi:predicted transcriptional regulator